MTNVWTITWRELKAYFASPIAYVVSAMFLAMMGFLFSSNLGYTKDANLRDTFNVMVFIVALVAPALTMKLLAEEQRMGTIELLLTSPIHDWQVVVGKFLGGVILYAVMFLAPTLYYVLVISVFGSPDYGPILTSYLGMLLLGSSFLAIGLFASALTQNQVVAFFISFMIMILLWIANAVTSLIGTGPVADVLGYLSIPRHFDFFSGIVDTTDLVFTLSIIVVALFLTTQLLQTRRWR